MVVKSVLSSEDFTAVLSRYEMWAFIRAEPIGHGSVQSNYLLHTTRGKAVFRWYENRSEESVLFEAELLCYLTEQAYPCPRPILNRQGTCTGVYRGKSFMIFEFIEGRHIDQPAWRHKQAIIEQVAALQRLTRQYRPPHTADRWNYSPGLCRALAYERAIALGSDDARAKYEWLAQELAALELPAALPEGICHCDFHPTNVLFQGDELVGVLDFDDANYTYLAFDLVVLIDSWAWLHGADTLNVGEARKIADEYTAHRALEPIEKQHIFDLYKLSVLIDCVWHFERGTATNCLERRKIDALTALGRQELTDILFGG